MPLIFTSNPIFSCHILHNLFTVATVDRQLLKHSVIFQPYFFYVILSSSYNSSSVAPVNTFSVNSLNINIGTFVFGTPCFSFNMVSLGALIHFSGIQPPSKTFKMTNWINSTIHVLCAYTRATIIGENQRKKKLVLHHVCGIQTDPGHQHCLVIILLSIDTALY